MLPEKANGELPVTVDHSQLRTMASEMVNPIDWPLPSILHIRRAVPRELNVLHGENWGHKSHDLHQPLGRERLTIGMPGQRTACVTTRGIRCFRLNISGVLLDEFVSSHSTSLGYVREMSEG